MTLRQLDITVAHTLGQQVAFDRMLAWLQNQNGHNTNVKVLSVGIDNVEFNIRMSLIVYGYRVDVAIIARPNEVSIGSNKATDLVESAAMWWEGLQLKSELRKVLA